MSGNPPDHPHYPSQLPQQHMQQAQYPPSINQHPHDPPHGPPANYGPPYGRMADGPGGQPPPQNGDQYPRMYPDYMAPAGSHAPSAPPHQQGSHGGMQPPHLQHGPPPPPHMQGSQAPPPISSANVNGMMQSTPPSHGGPSQHAGHHTPMSQHGQHGQASLPPPSSGQAPPTQPPPAHHPMGQGPQPPTITQPSAPSGPSPQGPAYDQARPLNVKDALTYLDQVKIQFQDFPHVYNQFLDIMKDFKAQTIDTPGVIDRVSTLFRGYPNLINGFNTFLPPGYRLEAPANPKDPVRVTTPQSSSGAHGEHSTTYTTSGSAASHQVYYTGGSGSHTVYNQAPAPPITHSPPYPHAPPPSTAHHTTAGQPPAITSQQVVPPVTPAIAPGAPPIAPQAPPPVSSQQGPPPPPTFSAPPPTAAPPPAAPTASTGSTPPAQAGTVASGSGGAASGTPSRKAPVEFNHAINYVNKIKNRFAAEPETYKQFLEILQTYQKEQRPIQEVYGQVQVLFKNAPDLLDEFKQFLPDTSAPTSQTRLPQNGARMPPVGSFMQSSGDRRASTGMAGAAVSQGKKGAKRTAPGTSGAPPSSSSAIGAGLPPNKKRAKSGATVQGSSTSNASAGAAASSQASLPRPETIEELEWIDRCKRTIGNKATYHEFLKVLNLFSHGYIDAKTLVECVEPFLSRAPELFEWFKKFVKFDEDVVITNTPAERPDVDLRQCKKVGHSYRLLPPSVPRSACSGRDDIAKEVLNDDWISQPEYVSETGFVAHKKTQYEEALHKCEEERYEFDINIEANLHTIALLEPIYRKIQTMNHDEKAKFKLSPGLGGQSTTIYQRVIKKIYDKDKGQEVIDALYNSPAIAVPVVLKRLKQKDEEWKRAQRDWNKIWREIDAKNYYKALDHQGITFKASDRKTMSAKALASEIENIYREQRERKALLTTQAATPAGLKDSVPLTRYQIEFRYKDLEIFTDVRRLIMDQVTHAQNISQSDEERIEEFLVNFVRRFFCVESVDVVRITPKREDDAESGSGDNEDSGSVANGDDSAMSVTNGENHTNGTGLRKDLLVRRAEAGGLVGVKKEADDDEIMSSTSVDENVAGSSSESKKKEAGKGKPETAVKPGSPRKRRSTFTFYANANFYTFFRLHQMLYARLVKMKELSQHLAENPPRAETLNSIAVDLGIQTKERSPDAIIPNIKDRYAQLLRAIHEMFDSKMDVNEFEDRCRALFGTSGYLMFTVDKLVQTIIRQIQAIQSDPKGHDLVDLYLKDRDKPSTSSRQDAVYRLGAEGLLPEENLYRLEYYVRERALTIQLIVKDDSAVDDTISTEEKWSMYVDHFIQLSTTEGIRLRQRTGPFLRRNLPSRIPDDPPTDVESRSGLELKICLNTYKIFFVENTEDYFFRRRPPVTSTVIESKKNVAEASAARFRSWHEERMKEIEAEAEAEAEAAAAEAAAAVLRKEEATKMAVDEEGAGNALEELTRDLRDVGMNFAKEVAKDGDAMEVDEGAVNPNPVDTAPEEADDKKGKCGETAVDLEKEEGKVADATAMAVDG